MRLQSVIVILIYVISNQILSFVFYFNLSIIYFKLYIILLKYIYIYKTTTNLTANKKINQNFNIFKIKNIIVEFR